MSKEDILDELEVFYPEIITAMGKTFNSHEFIAYLAKNHSKKYKELLSFYSKEKSHQSVHSQLAKRLNNFPHLIAQSHQVPSKNVKGGWSNVMSWKKVQ